MSDFVKAFLFGLLTGGLAIWSMFPTPAKVLAEEQQGIFLQFKGRVYSAFPVSIGDPPEIVKEPMPLMRGGKPTR